MPLNPADALGISFLLRWDESVRDLDLHVTAPVADPSADADAFPFPTTTGAQFRHHGFGPTITANRTEAYHARAAYPSTANPSIALLLPAAVSAAVPSAQGLCERRTAGGGGAG